MVTTAGDQIAGQANANKNKDVFGSIIYNVKAYGAKGDWNNLTGTGTDDTVAIQKTITAAYAANGGTVFFPPGTFRFSSSLVMDQTLLTDSNNTKRINFIGSGSADTKLVFSGTGPALNYMGGQSGEGHHSNQTIQGIYFSGYGITGSTGVSIQNAAFIQLIDVKISGFDLALNLQDVETSRFESVTLRFNKKGVFAQQKPVPGYPVSTRPNILTFVSCQLGGNTEFGGHFIGGACINWVGGSIEGNGVGGVNPSRWGIKFEDSCYQGGVACILTGVYFEHNQGEADIFLLSTTSAIPDVNPASYVVEGCSFNRTSNTEYVNHCIKASFSESAGKQTLNVIGCGFKRYGTYVADATRKNIYFDNMPMSNDTLNISGNMFHDDIESIKPQIFGNLKNLFPDGNCQVARWKDATLSATKAYGKAEQYMGYGTAVTAGTITHDPLATTGVVNKAAKLAAVTTSGTTGEVSIVTRIESATAKLLKNKFATLSCKTFHDSSPFLNCAFIVRVANALNDFTATTTVFTSQDMTVFANNEKRLIANSISMQDCSNGIEVEIKFKCGTVTSKNFWATDFQLIEGDVAKEIDRQPFVDAVVSCNRFLYTTFPDGITPAQNSNSTAGCISYAVQVAGSSGIWTGNVRLPVPMAKTPTVTFYNPKAANTNWYNSLSGVDSGASVATHVSNVSFDAVNTQLAGDAGGQTILVHATADARL